MKNISNVADFQIEKVLLTKTLSKGVHVTNKLGRFGTGIPIAPVLLFELYLAINHSSTSQYFHSTSHDGKWWKIENFYFE